MWVRAARRAALLYAMRERQEGGGGGALVREVLTARRGQRPSEWVTWEEARGAILGWAGYGIMAVQRAAASAEP